MRFYLQIMVEQVLHTGRLRQGSALHPFKNLRFLKISYLLPRWDNTYSAAAYPRPSAAQGAGDQEGGL